MFVQEQTGNITYDITGFKRIMICDELEDLRNLGVVEDKELYSIRVSFQHEGKSASDFILGRYADYRDAQPYYDMLIGKLAAGEAFASMVPVHEREVQERE